MSEQRQSGVSPRLIVGAVLVVLLLVFAVENRHQTRIRFIIPEVTAPLWLALLVSALIGAAACALLTRQRHQRT
jgi:uncharacterized integral membrane protein